MTTPDQPDTIQPEQFDSFESEQQSKQSSVEDAIWFYVVNYLSNPSSNTSCFLDCSASIP